ncbi:MAG: glycine zipper domain-containing protein [Hyphomonas sp.]
MATPQTSNRKSSRARINGHDKKLAAAEAARNDLHAAQEAAETFVSAVKSSANHFSEHLGRAVGEKVEKAQHGAETVADKAADVRHRLEDTIRERPLVSIGAAAGAGALLALLARR